MQEAERRSKRLAKALKRLGSMPAIASETLAWNGYRHYELYFGVSGIGAVLPHRQSAPLRRAVRYIVNHAEDKVVSSTSASRPLVEKLAAEWKPVRHYVAMTDRAHMPAIIFPALLCYEELLDAETPDMDWPEFDEGTASSLCYTSGTTGNPKGVLYSHRSTVLHAFSCCMANNTAIAMWDSVCPVVPMFHVNAWGIPYSAAMAGRSWCFPAPNLDGASLYDLFQAERVTIGLGVPTVWLALLKYLDEGNKRFDVLKRVVVGGSALAPAMIRAFEDKHGVRAIQGWGMTEMTRWARSARSRPNSRACRGRHRKRSRAKQGRSLYGVEMKLVDADGEAQPHDGQSPWRAPGARALDHRRLFPGRGGDAGGLRRGGLVSAPATSAPSMPTAICRSSTAART